MKIDLKKYMQERDEMRAASQEPGPVVTISRQLGCEANKLAIKLIAAIAEKRHELLDRQPWKYINKEILEESATELGLHPFRLEHHLTEKDEVGELFSSLTAHYKLSDKMIIEKITDIIQTYAHEGHLIIVGRGGTYLTQHIPRSIHVKMVAPFEWRVEKISRTEGISPEDSKNLVTKIDERRINWSKNLAGDQFGDEHFDLILNRAKLEPDEMVTLMMNLLEAREMI